MKSKKYLTMLLIIFSAALLHAQKVIKPGNLSGSLRNQFNNAFEQSKNSGDFWIGYSITRNDSRGIFIGSYYDYNFGISLRDIIMSTKNITDRKSGVTINKNRKNRGRSLHINHSFSFGDGTVPDKETAILFRYNADSKSINDFTEIGICNLSHNFDLDGSTLTWLGSKDNKLSVDFLFDLYRNAGTLKEKKKLIGGIGIHTGQAEVTPFLANLLKRKGDKDLREDVAFWVGLQNNKTALTVLKETVSNDRDSDIRKNAVYGIGLMDLPGIVDELVHIAKTNSDMEVRKSAVYALGNKAVKKAEEALKDFIENDADIDIKKSAVYALANTSKDYVPYLIRIAKSNPNLEIRKCAIYSLSNSDDQRAFDALVDLAKNN